MVNRREPPPVTQPVWRLLRLPAWISGFILLWGVIASCGSDSVHIPEFTPAATEAPACAELMPLLPKELGNQPQRETTGSEFGAAWGSPALVLRCGVGEPDGFDGFSQCQRANGIDWFIPPELFDDLTADLVVTTIGREPGLEVRVPAQYRPASPANVMIDLEPVIRAATTHTFSCG